MTISSIGNPVAMSMQAAQQSARYASTGNEAQEVGPDIDGDADDSGAKAVQAQPQTQPPVVNASGQTIGTTINVTA
ncbi:hypothetical protein [Paraburkholderia kururiensis]|uniref:Uncharacterized protein n=1 Tax=Paraburkholderia kururiensis TaxID=984307 RepID=A0ABZ0WJP5_9BURK|nr:hypothetical protein [Paraburkholderia kururiensis]WQD77574.1 hypothetical protein U0042_26590 [Paraburkholderia kururiensis]